MRGPHIAVDGKMVLFIGSKKRVILAALAAQAADTAEPAVQ
jgi:hypothetical protein